MDKYIGDAIMAFFGAPVKHEDDALQSVLAGIEMDEALASFNANQDQPGQAASSASGSASTTGWSRWATSAPRPR